MLAQLQTLPLIFFAVITTIGAAYAFIDMCESSMRPEKLKNIADKLMTVSFRVGARKILALYLNLNTTIFGNKIFSLRSFIASLFLTTLWAGTLILIYCWFFASFREWMLNILQLQSLRGPALAVLISVLLVDYLSICMSRKLYRITLSKGKRSFALAIIVDLLLSVAIYYLGISLLKGLVLHHELMPPQDAIRTWLDPTQLSSIFSTSQGIRLFQWQVCGGWYFCLQ